MLKELLHTLTSIKKKENCQLCENHSGIIETSTFSRLYRCILKCFTEWVYMGNEEQCGLLQKDPVRILFLI